MASFHRAKALNLIRQAGLVRPRDLVSAAVPAWVLYELVNEGEVERVDRGIYRRKNHSATERVTTEDLYRFACVCRVLNVMRPCLEGVPE